MTDDSSEQVMRGKDAAERPPPRAPMGGYQASWPFAVAFGAVALVVVVVILVNALAGGGTTGSRQQGTGLTQSGAAACPEFFENVPSKGTSILPWVPAKPAGVHSKQKLVPKLHPTHVTVCRYRSLQQHAARTLPLSGQRELGGRLDSVVDTLRTLPKAAKDGADRCPDLATSEGGDEYLIGLRYAEAIVWVSAPADPCFGAGNGAFRTARSVAGYAAASYAAGSWVSSP